MNFIVYTLRYLFVMGQVAYEENYWDQVRFNEVWWGVVERMSKETKK